MRAPEPMYATIGATMPAGDDWTFEQKYDGMRVIALVSPRTIRLVTRNGREKAEQFPEIVDALRRLAAKVRHALILDGEIVAMHRGVPAPFQALQSRMQLKNAAQIGASASRAPASFVIFDILQDGRAKLARQPWHVRRGRLEQRVKPSADSRILISESSSDGLRMIARARHYGWEGVIAKRVNATYVPGARSTAWLKLKLQHRAEFVVGGYTEPRRSRVHIGALLLGYFDAKGRLCYAGHMGGGFNAESLSTMLKRLKPLERRTSPFAEAFTTNEPAHWVRPTVVVEAKFAEWTADGKLRQPIFLGVRDDKNARDVHRERESLQEWGAETATMATRAARGTKRATTRRVETLGGVRRLGGANAMRSASGSIVRQLDDIEQASGDGVLDFGRGNTLKVSSLGKLFFPESGITKGDLMRYYATVAPVLLPVVEDRPLVLRRYPNGIGGSSFFQQNAGDNVPDGIRTARIKTGHGEPADRLIGGDLMTLLYIVQVGAIAVHTWQSRTQSASFADTATIDLDPGEDVSFSAVVTLARNIKAELDELRLRAAIKTSGSSGIHIAVPLPPKTTFDDGARLAQLVAERVVAAQPRRATLERSLGKRPAGTIYIDAQQNAEGKSVVAAYSVREREPAPVSAPLDWRELRSSLRIDAFTVATMPSRIRRVGDLWGAALKRRNPSRVIERVLGEG
ncbi:MAG TPA: DNA ligase D [Gemmatimonadaceae bacterium]